MRKGWHSRESEKLRVLREAYVGAQAEGCSCNKAKSKKSFQRIEEIFSAILTAVQAKKLQTLNAQRQLAVVSIAAP